MPNSPKAYRNVASVSVVTVDILARNVAVKLLFEDKLDIKAFQMWRTQNEQDKTFWKFFFFFLLVLFFSC